MSELYKKISRNLSKVIVGKEDPIKLVITALFSSGHILIDDVPGQGKTLLAKSLARSIDADFKRIQFTPDLLPSDLTGISFYNQKDGDFQFRPGPLMTQIALTDEINRATPRTQSSLLEAMGERQITVDGETHILKEPFFVIATQNPVESQGTFPLPEAQLDRFFMKISLGYPSPHEEVDILYRFKEENPLEALKPVCTQNDIIRERKECSKVFVHKDIARYIVDIVGKTRSNENIELGISPRGSLALIKGAQSFAVINGRDYVIPEDVQFLAPGILSHRLILKERALFKGGETGEIIREIIESVAVPTEVI